MNENPTDSGNPSSEVDGAASSVVEPSPPPALQPVAEPERLEVVDTLRGFALLGILVMNVYAFAMPFAAYSNPLLYGGSTGVSYWTWIVTHMFFDQKLMTLFSMLFGAGLVLMAERAEARGVAYGGTYYRRMFWLLVIGAAHGYLLWFGDILFHYALCGLLIYPLRRRSPKALITFGVVLILMGLPVSTGLGTFFAEQRRAGLAAEELAAGGETLDEAQEFARQSWAETRQFVEPSAEVLAEEIAAYRGGYLAIVRHRAPTVLMMQTFVTFTYVLWRVGGLMLIGMALMKLGVFSAARSSRYYRWCVGLGCGLGFPIMTYGLRQLTLHSFDGIHLFKVGNHYNYVGSIGVAFGYLGVVMLICRQGVWRRLRARLAAVGRMALTNYLMQSVLMTTLFYGYGFGLYGSVDRFPQMGFVVAVLALQLWWSPLWLRRYRFGPFEWVWRSLTYWRRQPMVKSRVE